MKRIFISIVTIFIALQAVAQDTIRVHLKGRVLDEKNEPVSFCLIKVQGQAAGTTANINGEYKLSFHSADSVVITYQMMGYRKRSKVLRKPQGNLNMNIIMYEGGHELSEVEVREIRRQMGQNTQVNTSELGTMPSSTGNAVEELVATQAGVTQRNELSSQYNVRGGSFDENCVYVNGIEIYRPLLMHTGEQEGLSVINPHMVDKVSFSAGGFEARYGDKMSSVLDITYKKPKGWEGNLSASLLGASGYMGYGNKKVSFSNSLRYKTNAYMLGAMKDKSEYSPNFVDYQAYLSWRPTSKWTIDVMGYISQNNYKFTPKTRNTSYGTLDNITNFQVYFDGWEQDLFQTYMVSGSARRQFSDKSSLTLGYSFFKTNERVTYDIQGQYWLYNTSEGSDLAVGTYMEHARDFLSSNRHTLRADYQHKTGRHDIAAGLMFRHEYVSEKSRQWEYRDSSGYSMPHTPDRLEVIYNLYGDNTITSNHVELYAQDTYRRETRSGILSLNYGMRMSYWTFNKEFLCSPRLSIGYVPKRHENLTLRLATGLYYQRPFYKELKDTVTYDHNTTIRLNRNIQSQRSFQVIGAIDYRFKLGTRPFLFSTELYYKAQDRLNPYTVNNTKTVYYGYNCATGNVMGIDFKLYGQFVPGTDSWLTFSLMRARMNIDGHSIPQPTDQLWNLNMFFTDYFPNTTRWKMNLRAVFSGGLPHGAPHTGLERHVFRSSAYKRVDVGLSFRALNNEDRHLRRANSIKNIWLGLDCLNIFGFDNVSGYYWVTDVHSNQYAVPNYLTGRLFNFRVSVDF
ncbi:MAG: TonB-dependent receptor [Bacteroidaceae bacterium]|nr:TonB-dependent receptor [Bacteroidaceae bacterium]